MVFGLLNTSTHGNTLEEPAIDLCRRWADLKNLPSTCAVDGRKHAMQNLAPSAGYRSDLRSQTYLSPASHQQWFCNGCRLSLLVHIQHNSLEIAQA